MFTIAFLFKTTISIVSKACFILNLPALIHKSKSNRYQLIFQTVWFDIDYIFYWSSKKIDILLMLHWKDRCFINVILIKCFLLIFERRSIENLVDIKSNNSKNQSTGFKWTWNPHAHFRLNPFVFIVDGVLVRKCLEAYSTNRKS